MTGWMGRVALLLLLLAAPSLDAAATPPAPLPPAARRLEKALDGLRGLRVDFVQVRSVDLTGEEIQASGLIAFRPPATFRLAYDPPDGQEVAVAGDSLWIYMPDERQALRYRFEADAPGSEIFLLFGGGHRRLNEVFEVVEEPWADHPDALRLTPRGAEPGYPLEEIRLLVDRRGYPRRLYYREVTGDAVVFDFVRLVLDPPDLKDLVRLKLPPGVQILDGEELEPEGMR